MGRILDAGDIGRATSASGAINSSLSALDSLQSELTDFADNPELQGKGWDSARAVINNVFNVLTDSYLMLGEMILQANAKLGDAASKLKSGYIDEDALKAQLDMIKQNIEMTHAAMAAAAAVDSTTGMGATMIRICEQRLRELEQQKKKIKEVLESLDDFDAATSGLYSSALALQSQINGLVTNVANKGTWSTSTGMFTTSKLNKELIKELKGQVKDYRTQSELLSFLADGGEIAVYKSAAKVNFHMEQTEKVGFKDAEVVIWYLVKGGVAINLNDSPELKDVSEFLRKKGPKLNKKAYREITYSEAQKMTADSTGGLNYFSYYFNQMTLPVKDLIGVALATKAVKMTGKFPGGDNDRVSATKGGEQGQKTLQGTFDTNSYQLVDKQLMKELLEKGVKYNPDNVVMTVRAHNGQTLWLEEGNSSAGLKHIISGKAKNFLERGISEEEIPEFLKQTLGTPPYHVGKNPIGPFADYTVAGKNYRVAYGTNGFIVSFYPID
ncbi:T7SS effector LXG polymorphic toxin [Lactovum odontotermitis]